MPMIFDLQILQARGSITQEKEDGPLTNTRFDHKIFRDVVFHVLNTRTILGTREKFTRLLLAIQISTRKC